MAKKRARIENEVQGGELTHNPFAALAGKSADPASASSPDAGAKERGQGSGRSDAKQGARQPKRGDAQATPQSGKLVVRHESKGHGGKTVTRISGLELGSQELQSLAKELRKAMGAGAREEESDVVVQGRLVERVALWLEARFGGRVIRGN